MVGLLDIASIADTVDVNGQQVTVTGLSVEGIASLLRRYPILHDVLSKGVSVENLMTAGPDVIAAIIAAGCGQPGNEQAEKIVKLMDLQTQIDLLAATLRRTMPRGIGPFLESLNRLMTLFSDPIDLMKAKIEQMKASPKPSKPLSDMVTPHAMSGQ